MPIFEYTCPKCKKEFEEYFSNHKSAESKKKLPCPECKTTSPRNLFNKGTSFNAQFLAFSRMK